MSFVAYFCSTFRSFLNFLHINTSLSSFNMFHAFEMYHCPYDPFMPYIRSKYYDFNLLIFQYHHIHFRIGLFAWERWCFPRNNDKNTNTSNKAQQTAMQFATIWHTASTNHTVTIAIKQTNKQTKINQPNNQTTKTREQTAIKHKSDNKKSERMSTDVKGF